MKQEKKRNNSKKSSKQNAREADTQTIIQETDNSLSKSRSSQGTKQPSQEESISASGKIKKKFVMSPAMSVELKESIKNDNIITDNSKIEEDKQNDNAQVMDAKRTRFLLHGSSNEDIIKKSFKDN